MHTGTLLPATYVIASGFAAYLLTRTISLPNSNTLRMLAALVLWQVIQIVPVHLQAALQMAGIVARVSMFPLAILQVVLLAAVAVWFRVRRPPPLWSGARPLLDDLPRHIWIAAVMLAGSYGIFVLNLPTSFPSGSDGLIYHLPLASRWLQDGSLDMAASGTWRFSLPGNAEVMMMVMLASGKQWSVALVNWISVAVLALSSYLFAMAMSKGHRAASVTVSLIVLSVPMVEFQIFSSYVDLVGTAAICAAFALLVNAVNPRRDGTGQLSSPLLLVAALACGISVGTKPQFYFYALMWAVFLVSYLWHRRALAGENVVKLAMLVGLACILPSGFWFARATVRTGNPVYPIRVNVGHHVHLPGLKPSEITETNFEDNFVHRPSEWPIYPWTEWKRTPGYLLIPYAEGDGLGAAFATFVPLGLAFLFLRSWRSGNRLDRFLLLFFGTGVLVWWFVMERVIRFGLPLIVFACVLSAPLLTVLQAHRKRTFGALLALSVLATSVISSFVPFHALAGRLRTHQWSRARIYGYPNLIDALPAGTRVLNGTGHQEENFPLAGEALTNHVITDFEAPAQLTAGSLRASGADLIADIVPGGAYSEATLRGAGATIIDDEIVLSGEERVRWRIWAVEKSLAH